MKKLLTLLSAATVAIGLYAYDDTGTSFETNSVGPFAISATDDLPLGNGNSGYWVTNGNADVNLEVKGYGAPGQHTIRQYVGTDQEKYLSIKTTFGNAVKRNIDQLGGLMTENGQFFFDSLVRFTVFEDSPTNIAATASDFADAKIAVWLQEEDENGTMATNLYVRALNLETNLPVNYNCGPFSGPDNWHRLTIKYIKNAYAGKSDEAVPSFVMFIDGGPRGTSADRGFNTKLLEGGAYVGFTDYLFPSLVQSGDEKRGIRSVSFDGQGDIDDLVFTQTPPFEAAEDGKVSVADFNGTPCETISNLVELVNGMSTAPASPVVKFYGDTAEDIAFACNFGLTIDLNGHTISNISTTAAAAIIDSTATQENPFGDGKVTGQVGLGDDSSIAAGTFDNTVTLASGTISGGRFINAEYSEYGNFADDLDVWASQGYEFVAGTGDNQNYLVLQEKGATLITITLKWDNGVTPSCTTNGVAVDISGLASGGTIDVADGAEVALTITNADGASKTLTITASSSVAEIDLTGTTFGWPEYLGDAVAGAYEIDSAAEFILFQKGVAAGLATANTTFKQTADVDLSDVDGFTGVGVTNTDSASGGTPFAGTYDGQGHKIANVKFSWRKYAGIFNQVNGATIQNLTGENLGFSETGSGEHGCAMVGNGVATLVALKSQYTGGFSVTNTHNAGGIMVRAMGGTTFNSCTNTADLVCCRDKMGGICCFMAPAANTTVAFVNCVNTGNYTLVTPPEGSKYNPGSNGFAGILGYTQGAGDVTMQGCKNTGSFVNNLDTTQFSNDVFSGEFIGRVTSSGAVTDLGVNKFVAANKVIGTNDTNSTFQYAIVDNGVGTTVTVLAKDTQYLLLKSVAASETPVFTLAAVGDTIAFDTALGYTFAGTIAVTGAGVEAVDATSGSVTTYTATITDAWAYRLGNPVDGAYVIDTPTELAAFAEGINVAKLSTVSKTFKLGANIDASSLGYFAGIGVQGTANSGLYNATFDGAGYTISNLSFDNSDSTRKYRGFFNRADGSVIKDLTINVVGFKDVDPSVEHGYAAFVGNMDNTTLLRCTATGTLGTTAKPTMHTTAGFAVKVASSGTFVDCTNYVNIVCSLNDNPKVGGIVGLVNGGSATVSNCWNFGSLTATPAGVKDAANGVGGLVGYSQGNLTIYGGGNAGTVAWTKTTTAHSNNNAINVGTIIGMETGSGKSATVSDGVVAQANAIPVGSGFAQVTGLNFATVDGNVATFVADNALAAGNAYKVMNAAATATYQFTAAGTIAFDTALATPTYNITATGNLVATPSTVGTVTTYTAALPQYTITYKNDDGTAFTSWADNYDAPATFTVESIATLPTANDVALGVGVTFQGWTNAVGTTILTTEGLTANLEVFAKLQAVVQPTIDPANPVSIDVTAASAGDAIDAVALVTPAGVDAAEYKALFNITATETSAGSGVYTVAVEGIKDTVVQGVEESAMAVLDQLLDAKVRVPNGLYYKVTTYSTLGGSAVETKSGMSDGTGVEVNKPGTTQGFIKIQMSANAIN